MTIIQRAQSPSGSRPPLQNFSGDSPPEGYAVVTQGAHVATFYNYNGFVTLEIAEEEGVPVVTGMTPNLEAWEAWRQSLPPESAPSPESPTPQTDTDELLVDLAYRVTLLELGLTDTGAEEVI